MPYQFVNGIRLRYETWGVGSTPLVLSTAWDRRPMIGFSSFRPLRRIICVWRWICAATASRTSRRAATRWGCSPLTWLP